MEAGLLGYLALIVGLRFVRPTDGQLPATSNELLGIACSPAALWLIASCTYAFRRGQIHESATTEPCWKKAGVVFAIGVLFTVAELLFFSYDYEADATAPAVRTEVGPQIAPRLVAAHGQGLRTLLI